MANVMPSVQIDAPPPPDSKENSCAQQAQDVIGPIACADSASDADYRAWLEHPKSKKYGVRWAEDVPGCELCDVRWTLFRRRHHCRSCGSLVCHSCSPARQHVSASPNPKRVCLRCIESKAAAQLLLLITAAAPAGGRR